MQYVNHLLPDDNSISMTRPMMFRIQSSEIIFRPRVLRKGELLCSVELGKSRWLMLQHGFIQEAGVGCLKQLGLPPVSACSTCVYTSNQADSRRS